MLENSAFAVALNLVFNFNALCCFNFKYEYILSMLRPTHGFPSHSFLTQQGSSGQAALTTCHMALRCLRPLLTPQSGAMESPPAEH